MSFNNNDNNNSNNKSRNNRRKKRKSKSNRKNRPKNQNQNNDNNNNINDNNNHGNINTDTNDINNNNPPQQTSSRVSKKKKNSSAAKPRTSQHKSKSLLSKPRSKVSSLLSTESKAYRRELSAKQQSNHHSWQREHGNNSMSSDVLPLIDERATPLVNQWNSFFSQCSCLEIFKHLNLVLGAMPNTDYEMHGKQYKIRGRQFIQHIMCEFQIELFRTKHNHSKHPNCILTEFQHRCGDYYVFHAFMSEMMKQMRSAQLIEYSTYAHSPWRGSNVLEMKFNDENDEKQCVLSLSHHRRRRHQNADPDSESNNNSNDGETRNPSPNSRSTSSTKPTPKPKTKSEKKMERKLKQRKKQQLFNQRQTFFDQIPEFDHSDDNDDDNVNTNTASSPSSNSNTSSSDSGLALDLLTLTLDENNNNNNNNRNNSNSDNIDIGNDNRPEDSIKDWETESLGVYMHCLNRGFAEEKRFASKMLIEYLNTGVEMDPVILKHRIAQLLRMEPLLLRKLCKLLLKCMDPEIAYRLSFMLWLLLSSERALREHAIATKLSKVFANVYRKWFVPSEVKFGSALKNNTLMHAPSMQVAEYMCKCIEVLENKRAQD